MFKFISFLIFFLVVVADYLFYLEGTSKIQILRKDIQELEKKLNAINDKIRDIQSGLFLSELRANGFKHTNEKIIKILNYSKIRSVIDNYENKQRDVILGNKSLNSIFILFLLFFFSLTLIILLLFVRFTNLYK